MGSSGKGLNGEEILFFQGNREKKRELEEFNEEIPERYYTDKNRVYGAVYKKMENINITNEE